MANLYEMGSERANINVQINEIIENNTIAKFGKRFRLDFSEWNSVDLNEYNELKNRKGLLDVQINAMRRKKDIAEILKIGEVASINDFFGNLAAINKIISKTNINSLNSLVGGLTGILINELTGGKYNLGPQIRMWKKIHFIDKNGKWNLIGNVTVGNYGGNEFPACGNCEFTNQCISAINNHALSEF